MSRLGAAQRVVAAVVLGAIFFFVGFYLTQQVPLIGWTGYAPLQTVAQRIERARDGLVPLANVFVLLGLAVGWCAGSFLLLRGLWERRAGAG